MALIYPFTHSSELNYVTFTGKNPHIPSEADSRKSSKYYARRNEYFRLFPPTRKPHKNLRDTHARSNAVTCVSTSVCYASVLGSPASGEGEVAFAAPSLVCRGSPHDYRITNKKT